MAKTLHFRVEKAFTNGTTGHLTIHARIIERDEGSEVLGMPEVWGCNPLFIESHFGGDVDKWREWVKDKMLANHQVRMKTYSQANDWAGKEWVI